MEIKIKEINLGRWFVNSCLVSLIVFLALEACTYDVKIVEPFIAPDTVSFSIRIIPIFEANCAKSGCHVTGGIPPDLSADNAYRSLIDNGLVELDTSKAEQSILYKEITPPGGMAKYITDPNQQPALILQWIKEGSKNN